jgi:hypothetical protein
MTPPAPRTETVRQPADAAPPAPQAPPDTPWQTPAKARIVAFVEVGAGYPAFVGQGKGGNYFQGTLVSALRIGLGRISFKPQARFGASVGYDVFFIDPASNIVGSSSTSATLLTQAFSFSAWWALASWAQLEVGGELGDARLSFAGTSGAEHSFVGGPRLGALIPFFSGRTAAWYVHPSYTPMVLPTPNLGTFWTHDVVLTVGVGF